MGLVSWLRSMPFLVFTVRNWFFNESKITNGSIFYVIDGVN